MFSAVVRQMIDRYFYLVVLILTSVRKLESFSKVTNDWWFIIHLLHTVFATCSSSSNPWRMGLWLPSSHNRDRRGGWRQGSRGLPSASACAIRLLCHHNKSIQDSISGGCRMSCAACGQHRCHRYLWQIHLLSAILTYSVGLGSHWDYLIPRGLSYGQSRSQRPRKVQGSVQCHHRKPLWCVSQRCRGKGIYKRYIP